MDARELDLHAEANRLVRLLNPFTRSPSAPLQAMARLESVGLSLMPRNWMNQGVVTGLSALTARAASKGVERVARGMAPPGSSLGRRLGIGGVLAGIGAAASRIPQREREPVGVAAARSAGKWLLAASLGGIAYDLGTAASARPGSEGHTMRRAVTAAVTVGGILVYARNELKERERSIDPGSAPLKIALPQAIVGGYAVEAIGLGLARGHRATKGMLLRYLGPGRSKRVLAFISNTALWGSAATAAYWAMIVRIGRANEKVDPGYAEPPTGQNVSGGPGSVVTFDELGQHGRRFILDVLTRETIEEVMGEPALNDPVRCFVGYNSAPLSFTGRAQLAMEELESRGALERSLVVLISPTGTGWVDHTMIEAAELFSRGDIASVCIQYGKYPSFLSLQKVTQGRRQFRLLLWGLRERLAGVPEKRRPRVVVFGESLGAWTSADALASYRGTKGFDYYGIDRALWVGMPHMARVVRNIRLGRGAEIVEGTAKSFDRPEQLLALDPHEKERLRAIVLNHDNDPIFRLGPDLIVRRPPWVEEPLGRNVPRGIRWTPVISFLQTAVDAANAMRVVPGEFLSTGHDYRADIASFVREAFRFTRVTDEQVERVEQALRTMEVERSDKIQGAAAS